LILRFSLDQAALKRGRYAERFENCIGGIRSSVGSHGVRSMAQFPGSNHHQCRKSDCSPESLDSGGIACADTTDLARIV
jgi:hypothetical protein